MKWFKHETNSGFDAKMKKLLMKYGVNGYGLYYYCVEIIAGNLTTENITFELEHDSEILAHDLKMDSRLVEEIMLYCLELGLFELNKTNNRIVHFKLFDMLDNTMSQNICIKQMKSSENFKFLKDSKSRREENRREENRIEEKRREEKKFKRPSLAELRQYNEEKQLNIDCERFFDHYEQIGWLVGKAKHKMKDWKAAMRNWSRNDREWSKPKLTAEQQAIMEKY